MREKGSSTWPSTYGGPCVLFAGVVVHRTAGLDGRVRWNSSPPRVRIEHAAIDVAAGEPDATSVLEREYLRPERLHGLPSGGPDVARQRPVRDGTRSRYQDVRYEGYDVTVELDGRAFHDNAADRDGDAERDLDHVLVTDGPTIRLTYGQVFRRGCTTLGKIALLLGRRGWDGSFRRCPSCPDSRSGASR